MMNFDIYFCAGHSRNLLLKGRNGIAYHPFLPRLLGGSKRRSHECVRVCPPANGNPHRCTGRDRHQKEVGSRMEATLSQCFFLYFDRKRIPVLYIMRYLLPYRSPEILSVLDIRHRRALIRVILNCQMILRVILYVFHTHFHVCLFINNIWSHIVNITSLQLNYIRNIICSLNGRCSLHS